jgi:hypothetical protein
MGAIMAHDVQVAYWIGFFSGVLSAAAAIYLAERYGRNSK